MQQGRIKVLFIPLENGERFCLFTLLSELTYTIIEGSLFCILYTYIYIIDKTNRRFGIIVLSVGVALRISTFPVLDLS